MQIPTERSKGRTMLVGPIPKRRSLGHVSMTRQCSEHCPESVISVAVTASRFSTGWLTQLLTMAMILNSAKSSGRPAPAKGKAGVSGVHAAQQTEECFSLPLIVGHRTYLMVLAQRCRSGWDGKLRPISIRSDRRRPLRTARRHSLLLFNHTVTQRHRRLFHLSLLLQRRHYYCQATCISSVDSRPAEKMSDAHFCKSPFRILMPGSVKRPIVSARPGTPFS